MTAEERETILDNIPDNKEERKRKGKTNSNAHKAAKTISLIAITTVLTAGLTIAGISYHKDCVENQIAKEIVSTNTTYIGNSKTLSLQTANVNKDYDVKVCSGSKLEDNIISSEIEVCQIGDTLYTNEGCDIAILEFKVTRKESKPANATKLEDGTTIYTADDGYTLDGSNQIKVTISNEKKIISANASHDYSKETYQGENVTSSELITTATEEYPTHPYSEISESTLILDVEDNTATYRLSKNN